MATTTTQYVTTDYLNNEEFLKASNIKAGSNITLSTSGKNVTINASGGTELNYYHEYTASHGVWIDANSFQVTANSTFVFGPLYVKTSTDEISNGIMLAGNSTIIGGGIANVSLQGASVSVDDCTIFKVGPVHNIELKTLNSNGPDFIGCEAHLDDNNAYLYAKSSIELHANSTFVFGPLYAGGTAFYAGPDAVLVNNVNPVLSVTSSDDSVTIDKSGYNVDIRANGSGPTLTYYHESGTDVSIETPDHINFKANDTIYFEGPTMNIWCNDKISITASATDNYINLANDCIEINADTDANIAAGNTIYINSNNSIFAAGPYVFVGDTNLTDGIHYEKKSNDKTYINLNADVIHAVAQSSVFMTGPQFTVGANNSSPALEFVNQGAHNRIILNTNSVYIIGPENSASDFYVQATNTKLSSSIFAIGPCGLLSMNSDTINLNSLNSIFISGPYIQLNQPEEPGISITPNNIVLSMTENAGTPSQNLGTTLTFTKDDAKITAYTTGTGKEFEFNVHTIDVLDRNINKYFEKIIRIDGIGGSDAWIPMKNHGIYYFDEFEPGRPEGDLDFNFPADGMLTIDTDSNRDSLDETTVRTAEIHLKFDKNRVGIHWPDDWKWVDESNPDVPPSIPVSEHGKWCCFTVRKSVMPDGSTFTCAALSYTYGTAITE